MSLAPMVPPGIFRTERAYKALSRVFKALAEYEAIANASERPPARDAGWSDILGQVAECKYGLGQLAESERFKRDKQVEAARIAAMPQRRRRRVVIQGVTAEQVNGHEPKRA